MHSTQRTFIPGDSWVYYKIYTGAKTSDTLLTEIIKPVAQQLIDQEVIDQWFFIRYADPKHHIRVRFHCEDKNNIGKVIRGLYEGLSAFAKADLIWKVQLDTYNREIERYGAEHIELAEKLFYHESKMIVNLLDAIGGDEGEQIRWLFGIRALDTMLSNVGFSEDEKLEFMERLKTSFGLEFGMNKHLKKQLDKKFREYRDNISFIMELKEEEGSEYNVLLELLDQKTRESSPVIKQLITSLDKRTLHNYVGSYAHMLMNRLFRSKNRLHEMVVYDLLYRHYKTAWGIRTFKNKTE